MPKNSYGTRKFISDFKEKLGKKNGMWEAEGISQSSTWSTSSPRALGGNPSDPWRTRDDEGPGSRSNFVCYSPGLIGGGTQYLEVGTCWNDGNCSNACNNGCTDNCATCGEVQAYPADQANQCTVCATMSNSNCLWGTNCACNCNQQACTANSTHGDGYSYTCHDTNACNYDAPPECQNGGTTYAAYCNQTGTCQYLDCYGTCGGSAGYDSCGTCCGGDTNVSCCFPPDNCGSSCDCNGNVLGCDDVCDSGKTNYTCYRDADSDNLGDPNDSVSHCGVWPACPSGYVTDATDVFPECGCGDNNQDSCFDECGVCTGPGRIDCDSAGGSFCSDGDQTYCPGTESSDCSLIDACGVCGGPGRLDCDNAPNGAGEWEDYCQTSSNETYCPGTEHNDCAVRDACGVCGGPCFDESTCTYGTDSCADCNNTPNGSAYFDNCDDCCDGTTGYACNSYQDECGECGGPGTYANCDCDGNIIVDDYNGRTICDCGLSDGSQEGGASGYPFTIDSCGRCLYDSPGKTSGRLDEGENFYASMNGAQGPYEYPCACPNAGLYPNNQGNMAWFDYCGVCGVDSTPFTGFLGNNCAELNCKDPMAWNCCPAGGLAPVPYNTEHFGVVSCSDCTECATWEANGKGNGVTLTPSTTCFDTEEVEFPNGSVHPFWKSTCRYPVTCPIVGDSNYTSFCDTLPWGAEQCDEDPFGDGCAGDALANMGMI